MKTQLSQIELIADIMQLLDEKYEVKLISARHTKAIIAGVNGIMAEFRREDVPATTGMGLTVWLLGDDTGASSKFMAQWIRGWRGIDAYWPRDPGDFGRCYRLLQAVPEFRIADMADAPDPWPALVAAWPELTALYEEKLPCGECPKLYARLQEELVK